jgi:anti-sigma regulatory factor (Ser/Thr protein kinase)
LRELILDTDDACAADARRFALECLKEGGFSEMETFDVLLAVNEAVANACRHAYPGRGGRITLRCGLDGTEFVITVSDEGKGFSFDDSMFEMPDPLAAQGRGFFLMSSLMDTVQVHSDGLGTVVTMRRANVDRSMANGH